MWKRNDTLTKQIIYTNEKEIQEERNEKIVRKKPASTSLLFSTYLLHRRPPEVVEEEIGHGCVWTQVAVLLDGRDVIEHKAATEGVAVDEERHGQHQGAVHPTAHRPACRERRDTRLLGHSNGTRRGREQDIWLLGMECLLGNWATHMNQINR